MATYTTQELSDILKVEKNYITSHLRYSGIRPINPGKRPLYWQEEALLFLQKDHSAPQGWIYQRDIIPLGLIPYDISDNILYKYIINSKVKTAKFKRNGISQFCTFVLETEIPKLIKYISTRTKFIEKAKRKKTPSYTIDTSKKAQELFDLCHGFFSLEKCKKFCDINYWPKTIPLCFASEE